MCSWKTTRTFCAILLVLPLLHLALLMSSETLSLLDATPGAWKADVAAYNEALVIEELPENPVVVIGGRLVTLWPGLEQALAPKPVLMRGLGDATVDDITHYYQSLVGVYRPETVVLLPSDSNFHLRDYKSANEMVDSIKRLVALDAAHGRTRVFYVFAPLQTPRYPGDRATLHRVSTELQRWAARRHGVEVLDANPLLANADGPDPRWFRSDGVHLNDGGFLRLSVLLQQAMAEQTVDQANRVALHNP